SPGIILGEWAPVIVTVSFTHIDAGISSMETETSTQFPKLQALHVSPPHSTPFCRSSGRGPRLVHFLHSGSVTPPASEGVSATTIFFPSLFKHGFPLGGSFAATEPPHSSVWQSPSCC